MTQPARAGIASAALLATVIAANYLSARYGLVSAGFGLLVSAGTYAAGAALAIRDALDRAGGLKWVLPTLVAGIALSAIVAGPQLAMASAVAFGLSELVDLGVFRALRRRSLVAAIAGSNLIGAIVDTLVFLPLAGFPLTPVSAGGQVLVKAVYLTVAALAVLAALRNSRARA